MLCTMAVTMFTPLPGEEVHTIELLETVPEKNTEVPVTHGKFISRFFAIILFSLETSLCTISTAFNFHFCLTI